VVAAPRTSPNSASNWAVPQAYATWRRTRWLDIAGPRGKARIAGNGLIVDRDVHTFPGVPGRWSTADDGTLVVTAAAQEGLRVNGETVTGPVEVPAGRSLDFPDGRTGQVDGSTGGYSFIFFDPAAFEASGISQIDYYPYDPGWVVPGELRAAPRGRSVEVERLSSPRAVHQFPTPFDLALTIGDVEYVLTVLESSPGRRLAIFTDETSGTHTPDIGRWLTLPAPEAGHLPIDLNRTTLSYHHVNPALFHCPLPPPGNHLPVRVEAGEHTLVLGQRVGQ
jgi:uncharacterized protein (DUF1684 family)